MQGRQGCFAGSMYEYVAGWPVVNSILANLACSGAEDCDGGRDPEGRIPPCVSLCALWRVPRPETPRRRPDRCGSCFARASTSILVQAQREAAFAKQLVEDIGDKQVWRPRRPDAGSVSKEAKLEELKAVQLAQSASSEQAPAQVPLGPCRRSSAGIEAAMMLAEASAAQEIRGLLGSAAGLGRWDV